MNDIDLSQHADVIDAVKQTLSTQLGIPGESIDLDDSLDLLPNADSVRLMRSVSALERQFNIELDDEAIRDAKTVADLTRLLSAELVGTGDGQ